LCMLCDNGEHPANQRERAKSKYIYDSTRGSPANRNCGMRRDRGAVQFGLGIYMQR
jgi:hypothetical protein